MRPLAAPTATPVPMIAAIVSTLDWVSPQTIAPTTPESATVEPTERSMPLDTITSSWPSARTAITEVCENTFPMFRLVRNTGVVTATATINRNRISAGPNRSESSAPWSRR